MIISAEHISCLVFQLDIEAEPHYHKYLIMITSFPLVSWDNLSLCRLTMFKYSYSNIKTMFYFYETSASSHSQLLAGSLFIYYFLITQRLSMAICLYIFLVINPNTSATSYLSTLICIFVNRFLITICFLYLFRCQFL